MKYPFLIYQFGNGAKKKKDNAIHNPHAFQNWLSKLIQYYMSCLNEAEEKNFLEPCQWFFFIYFNWRIITLQYCGGFCYTSEAGNFKTADLRLTILNMPMGFPGVLVLKNPPASTGDIK